MKKITLYRSLKHVSLRFFNLIFIYEYLTIFSLSLASKSDKMRPVPIAKKARMTQEECEDFDITTHQASQSDDSSEEDLMTTAFTKVPPLKNKGNKAKKSKGIYMKYKILIHIKN